MIFISAGALQTVGILEGSQERIVEKTASHEPSSLTMAATHLSACHSAHRDSHVIQHTFQPGSHPPSPPS